MITLNIRYGSNFMMAYSIVTSDSKSNKTDLCIYDKFQSQRSKWQ